MPIKYRFEKTKIWVKYNGDQVVKIPNVMPEYFKHQIMKLIIMYNWYMEKENAFIDAIRRTLAYKGIYVRINSLSFTCSICLKLHFSISVL